MFTTVHGAFVIFVKNILIIIIVRIAMNVPKVYLTCVSSKLCHEYEQKEQSRYRILPPRETQLVPVVPSPTAEAGNQVGNNDDDDDYYNLSDHGVQEENCLKN